MCQLIGARCSVFFLRTPSRRGVERLRCAASRHTLRGFQWPLRLDPCHSERLSKTRVPANLYGQGTAGGVKRISVRGALLGLLLQGLMRTSREVNEYGILAYPPSNGIICL
ncbi:hypothetical protein, possibly linked to the general secretion pathway [Sinorhizobium fredii NGR234]|uniref:Uncharacterized protein n=1 Tax=Sinorhizobium fredii (strain NBRC 101917 / NGR234) TaxID=394 RepID=C3MFK0_SINFN|nr:hypothetical protein, possibly linked to the general secretion pathway [Sinorhizobium fredii NGR234]